MLKNCLRLHYVIVVGLAVSCGIKADEPDVPVVTLRAELRVPQTDGVNTYRYVPASKVEQGQEIYYTVRITNPGMTPLVAATVVQALPVNTHYVGGSATGAGADIQFSVDDGRSFAKPAGLRSPVYADRVASAAEYTHIRWQLHYPLAAKAVVLARFRAVFE
jgi:uncharacterized repeat protein (TIGR01451 family)